MPRAALLSIHARVRGTKPATWEDPSLVQLWGPRYHVYVVAASDLAVFSLGTFPDDAKGRRRTEEIATSLHAHLAGGRMGYAEAGLGLGMHPNRLRYAAASGKVVIRWEGARQPSVWTVPASAVDPRAARLELARRYLHVFGPATAEAFGWWSGIGTRYAIATFESLGKSLMPVRTPLGEGWILARDEPAFRAAPRPAAPARLLPSGDTFFLFQGRDREFLVPDAPRRRELWTPRVWPGALLLGGDFAGTWRRAETTVTVTPWSRLTRVAREAVEAEAAALPLPGVRGPIRVRWED
jgi:hypothetical protein